MSEQIEEVKKEDNESNEEVLIKIKPPVTCDKGGHEFYRINGLEVKCKKCPVGYSLPVGAELKDEHIYIGSQFVI